MKVLLINSDEGGTIPVIEVSVLAIILAVAGFAFYAYNQNKLSHSSQQSHVPHANQGASVSLMPSSDDSELQTLKAEDQHLGLTKLATQTFRQEQPQGIGAGPLYPDVRY